MPTLMEIELRAQLERRDERILELENQLEKQTFRANKFEGALRTMRTCSAHIDRLKIANERIQELEKLLTEREADGVRLEWLAANPIIAKDIFFNIHTGQEKFLRGEIDYRMQHACGTRRCMMTTQHYVEHFASEMGKLRALDDKSQAKEIAYIAKDECMKAIKAMALPCPFCGGANLYFCRQTSSCLVICNACCAQKRGGAHSNSSAFTPESREWQMQNLADAVNAWNQRA